MKDLSQRGQALLIVVLVMVVTLTIGLSVASRSITNLRTSTEEENSQKAFSAAEAGVERALRSGTGLLEVPLDSNNTTTRIKNVEVQEINGTSFLVRGGNTIRQNEGVDVWLSEYSEDPLLLYKNPWTGAFTIYWGRSNMECSDPAIEVIVLSNSVAPTPPLTSRDGVQTTRHVADPCSDRRNANKFTAPGSGKTIGNVVFSHSLSIPSTTRGLIARVVPLYGSTEIGVEASSALPAQGKIINSTGVSGDTIRKITYYQGYPELPSELFQYILFQPK